MKKILFFIILGITLAGCQSEPPPEVNIEAPPIPVEEPEVPDDPPEEQGRSLQEFLGSQPTDPVEVATYLYAYKDDLSAKEQGWLLERLWVTGKAYNASALPTLNRLLPEDTKIALAKSTMTLDVINGFDLDEIREVLKKNYYSYHRFSLQGNKLVTTLDWERLYEEGIQLTPGEALLHKIRKNIIEDAYGDQYEKSTEIMLALDELEKELAQNYNQFERAMLADTYELLFNLWLVGIDGEHAMALITPTSRRSVAIKTAGEAFPDSYLAKVATRYEEAPPTTYDEVIELLGYDVGFSLLTGYELAIIQGSSGDSMVNKPQLAHPSKDHIAKKINDYLDHEISFILEELGLSLQLYSYISFANEDYLNIILFYSYSRESGQYHFVEKSYLFSLRDGEALNLQEFTGLSPQDFWKTFKSRLQSQDYIKAIDENTYFQLTDESILLQYKEEGLDEQVEGIIPYLYLMPYIDINTLY